MKSDLQQRSNLITIWWVSYWKGTSTLKRAARYACSSYVKLQQCLYGDIPWFSGSWSYDLPQIPSDPAIRSYIWWCFIIPIQSMGPFVYFHEWFILVMAKKMPVNILGGGFKDFLFLPQSLGRWSNLTGCIFFRWVGEKPATSNYFYHGHLIYFSGCNKP